MPSAEARPEYFFGHVGGIHHLIVVIFAVFILNYNDPLAIVDRKSTGRDGKNLT
ncbi:MAG: hypothetical protein RSP_03030 [Rhodanobacter sp.]